jgi:hypothetical protein
LDGRLWETAMTNIDTETLFRQVQAIKPTITRAEFDDYIHARHRAPAEDYPRYTKVGTFAWYDNTQARLAALAAKKYLQRKEV